MFYKVEWAKKRRREREGGRESRHMCRCVDQGIRESYHAHTLIHFYIAADPEFGRNELVLEHYPSGIRTLVVESKAKDSQFWAGNYGCKFAGLAIRVR